MINLFNWWKSALFASSWEALMLKGVLITILSVCFIAAPNHTVYILTRLFGILLLLSGAMALLGSSRINGQAVRGSMMLVGVFLLAAGAFMTFAPDGANFLLIAVIAFLSLSSGLHQIMLARHLKPLAWHMWLSGILAVILGLLILFLPAAALAVFGTIIGIYLLAFGIFNISLASVIRQKSL